MTIKRKLIEVLAEHDVYVDIPNDIIASTEAEHLVNDILSLIRSHLLKAIPKEIIRTSYADSGDAIKEYNIGHQKGVNKALREVIKAIKEAMR